MGTKHLLCEDRVYRVSPEGSNYIGYYFMLSWNVLLSCYKVIPILFTCVCSGRYRITYGSLSLEILYKCPL